MSDLRCLACGSNPAVPFEITNVGVTCGDACTEALREMALSLLAFDPGSREVLEDGLRSDDPFRRLAASKAIAIHDAVQAAPMN